MSQSLLDKFTNLSSLQLITNFRSQSLQLNNLRNLKKVAITGLFASNVIPDFEEKRSIEIFMKKAPTRTIRGDFSVHGGRMTGCGTMEMLNPFRIFTGEWKDGLSRGSFTLSEGGEIREIDLIEFSEFFELLSTP